MTVGPGIKQVLVVCTGNVCRSPMAAGILARLLAGTGVVVSSAGVAAVTGAPPTPEAERAAAELGVDITAHRARQLTSSMVRDADLVLVMSEQHRVWIREHAPDAVDRVKLVAAYPRDEGPDVADPIGGSLETYRRTALLMKAALLRVAADIRRQE